MIIIIIIIIFIIIIIIFIIAAVVAVIIISIYKRTIYVHNHHNATHIAQVYTSIARLACLFSKISGNL